jgi:hypothetical protein
MASPDDGLRKMSVLYGGPVARVGTRASGVAFDPAAGNYPVPPRPPAADDADWEDEDAYAEWLVRERAARTGRPVVGKTRTVVSRPAGRGRP